ncbi:hypothetical protein PFISCL1PPCAC_7322 [Pristionchus fissidentatus]|uniref:Uncharacterized protein n=1 Tax=Pristionchus fissidentatus TaxID=1538716 RepID=A0AAV5V8Q3_9BILA|nr:hypothetical protein PFISCL1PPCAC_7322 [Pristionchus fissidentatus]
MGDVDSSNAKYLELAEKLKEMEKRAIKAEIEVAEMKAEFETKMEEDAQNELAEGNEKKTMGGMNKAAVMDTVEGRRLRSSGPITDKEQEEKQKKMTKVCTLRLGVKRVKGEEIEDEEEKEKEEMERKIASLQKKVVDAREQMKNMEESKRSVIGSYEKQEKEMKEMKKKLAESSTVAAKCDRLEREKRELTLECNRLQEECAMMKNEMEGKKTAFREICGIRAIRTEHRTFVGVCGDWNICQAGCKYRWNVEDRNGHIALKSSHTNGRWLRAHEDGPLSLQVHCHSCELWTPFPNADGSWSFRSYNGRWLAGLGDGEVRTQPHKRSSERFWLDRC